MLPANACFRRNASHILRCLCLHLGLLAAFWPCVAPEAALAAQDSPPRSPSTSAITSPPNQLKPQGHKPHKASKKNRQAESLFVLNTLSGQRIADADFRGRPILLVFGYTFCPDACPTGLQNLSRILDLLGSDADKVHAVFVTLDPERDTEAKLKDYLKNFHPSIVGLRGSPEQTAAAAKALRVHYAKAESVGDDDYELDYAPVLTIIDANGKLAESLDDEQAPEDLLKVAQKYIPVTSR